MYEALHQRTIRIEVITGETKTFFVGTTRITSLSSDDFYPDLSLVQGLIRVEF
jgi:hypothetical protein